MVEELVPLQGRARRSDQRVDEPILQHRKISVAFFTNIPSLYRADMIDAWAANEIINLSVYYTNPSDQGRAWSTRAVTSAVERRLGIFLKLGRWGYLNRGLWNLVRNSDVVVIGGYEEASYLAVALLAVLQGCPVILLSDGFSPIRVGREAVHIALVKRLVRSLASTFLVNGHAGRLHLLSLGPLNRPVFNQFLCSHREPFVSSRKTPDEERDRFRKTLGFQQSTRIVLFCGYLTHRKRVDLCIKALANLAMTNDIGFVCIGNGPLEKTLCEQATLAGLRCVFPGFKEGDDLARYYNASDVFILPSDDDPWGLVVDEALAAGLTLVVSDACGCANDLVSIGKTGYIFRHDDIGDASRALLQALKLEREGVLGHTLNMLNEWNLDHAQAEFERAVKFCLET